MQRVNKHESAFQSAKAGVIGFPNFANLGVGKQRSSGRNSRTRRRAHVHLDCGEHAARIDRRRVDAGNREDRRRLAGCLGAARATAASVWFFILHFTASHFLEIQNALRPNFAEMRVAVPNNFELLLGGKLINPRFRVH